MPAIIILAFAYALNELSANLNTADYIVSQTEGWLTPALLPALTFLIAGIMNLVAIPHPLWFSIVSLLVFLPAAWLGGRIGAGRGTAGRTPAPE